LTDIRDPQIDQKPPPYECSSCSYTTWSWNEAKKHSCNTSKKEAAKSSKLPNLEGARVLYASITSSLLKPLIQLLEKASDGSTGEFKESTIALPSEPGRPLNLKIRRGAKDKNLDKTFSVSLELSQEE
jgi:hypothetical protein